MADLTPQDRLDAIREPRPGDVWRWAGMNREVYYTNERWVHYLREDDVDCVQEAKDWGPRMGERSATLVRRGA